MTREPKRDRHPRTVAKGWDPDLVEFRLRRAATRNPPCPTSWKRKHKTSESATAWGVLWKRDHPDDPIRFEPYECACKSWHLRDADKAETKRRVAAQRREARRNG